MQERDAMLCRNVQMGVVQKSWTLAISIPMFVVFAAKAPRFRSLGIFPLRHMSSGKTAEARPTAEH
jgi:hypothetical protein